MSKPKPGKWVKAIAHLPRIIGNQMSHDENHRKKVDEEKYRIINEEPRTSGHLAGKVAGLRRIRKDLEADLKVTNLLLDAYTELLVDQYESEGITSLRMADGGSVRLQWEPYSSVKETEKFIAWVKMHNLEHNLTMHWRVLDRLVKQALSVGEPEPDGVKVFQKIKAVHTPP